MASIEAVLNQRMNMIRRVIEKGLKTIVAEEIRETLIYRIETNLYSMGYSNRGNLVNSIRVNVEMQGKDSFLITVYFDDKRINHTSWFGSEDLGISVGDTVYSVEWINSGKSFVKGNRSLRLEDIGKTPHFLEDALRDLQTHTQWIDRFYNYLKNNGIELE